MKFALHEVLMYYMCRRNIMSDLIALLKDIFMIKASDDVKIGLSQFKPVIEKRPVELKPVSQKNVKISELMRKGF